MELKQGSSGDQSMSSNFAVIGTMLGSRSPIGSYLDVARKVEDGLPVAALERLARAIAPDDASFIGAVVPKATLSRRRASPAETLSVEEGNKVARLAKVWAFALGVWQDEDDARRFLGREHPMLDNRRPRDLAAASDPGADAVINVMGRGAYGGGV